jgi:SAM-dependent methyltransferase
MQRSFARAVCDFARTLSQQHAELYTASEQIRNEYGVLQERDVQFQRVLDRLGKVEQHTQELHRNNLESRVIARFEARFASLEEGIDMGRGQNASLEHQIQFANHRISGIESTLQFTNHRLATAELGAQTAATDIQRLWAGLAAEMGAREATDRGLIEVRSKTEEVLKAALNSNREVDSTLYVALQERFPGSREEIKKHQRMYVPILRDRGLGTSDTPIVDLECGRGEWLEILKAEGLIARGVDSNPHSVRTCTAIGLQVVEEDSLLYLAGLPTASVGGLTSFHMIEHLHFRLIVTLIDQALRVLKPGGLLILETPNPSNLFVGSHTFHLDPTHIKPIPSELLWFLMENRGFHRMRRLSLGRSFIYRIAQTNAICVLPFG